MKIHECVSFILMSGSRVLLEKRSKHKETDPSLITIPGGHIEGDETQIQALFRELDEELNVIKWHLLGSAPVDVVADSVSLKEVERVNHYL